MRDPYPRDGFLGAPKLDFGRSASEAVTHLFAEMDQVAEKLRTHPQFVEADLQIAFYQLQREWIRKSDREKLPRDEWLHLFAMWRDYDRGQQTIDDARFNALCDERERLFSERALLPPEQHGELTARLMEVGCEIAELAPTFPAAPLGEWG